MATYEEYRARGCHTVTGTSMTGTVQGKYYVMLRNGRLQRFPDRQTRSDWMKANADLLKWICPVGPSPPQPPPEEPQIFSDPLIPPSEPPAPPEANGGVGVGAESPSPTEGAGLGAVFLVVVLLILMAIGWSSWRRRK